MTPAPFLLRSTRRFPNPDEVSPEVENNEASGHQDYELRGKRREKKLKISSDYLFRSHLSILSVSISIRILTILKLTPRTMSLQQTSRSEKSIRSVKRSSILPDRWLTTLLRFLGRFKKEEKHVSDSKPTKALQGAPLDMGSSAPLPDRKL
ncbi:hypothetical protein Acr_09g0009370 [Actinidia rufa]|uniref:Uncharacterized protein n=1 Tax=Actinidia rufa TaxID=165716 RepID=A0A7J0F778_9ERIC|nr:hypothetical protein Acr_09g0009370 [Actinidia rufa]